MATVISKEAMEAHNVNQYNFKVLPTDKQEKSEEPSEKERITEVDSSSLSSSSKDSLIESLMQKTDEMSSNFIKLQMKLESKEEEYQASLAKVKEEAFAQGVEAGMLKTQEKLGDDAHKSIDQFSTSVIKLEESAKEFESALEGIKKELLSAALDISKEVIQIELGSSSNEIAKILSDELLKELQNASKITLKVNPLNHGAVSEHIGDLSHISIVSDSAVSEGGVIVMSDAGNIDSQISKRFERVKRDALSE